MIMIKMTFSKKYPKRPIPHIICREGEKTLEHYIPSKFDFKPSKSIEYGTDFEVEIARNEMMKGDEFKGQLKTHEKVKVIKDSYIKELIDYEHWNQWNQITSPFYLIVADIDDFNKDYSRRKLYWINIKDPRTQAIKNLSGVSVIIPKTNDLTKEDSFDKFIQDVDNELNILRQASDLRAYIPKKKVLDDKLLGRILGSAITFAVMGFLLKPISDFFANLFLSLGGLIAAFGFLRLSLVFKKNIRDNSKLTITHYRPNLQVNFLILVSLGLIWLCFSMVIAPLVLNLLLL